MYDSLGFDRSHSWTYYLLGGNKQQLAVYNGREITAPNACLDSVHRVHFYPTEYLTYGNGGSALISMRPNGKPEYKIVDHLGSTRVVLNDTGGVVMKMDFEPFGKEFDAPATGVRPRKSYIDRENDRESGLGNFGVRQMDDWSFTSIDPMWENYRAYSPYNYCGNNPVKLSDPDGKVWPLVVYGLVEAAVVAAAATVALYQAKQALDRMQGFPSTNPYSMSLNVPTSPAQPNVMQNSAESSGAGKAKEAAPQGSKSLEEQGKAIAAENKGNRVHMPDGSHIDVAGDGHFVKGKGEVKTPHVHDAVTNTNPATGQSFTKANANPRPATQADLDRAKDFIRKNIPKE